MGELRLDILRVRPLSEVVGGGPIHPVWAMTAMAVSVTAIFFNSLWGRPKLFFDAVLSVGRPVGRH